MVVQPGHEFGETDDESQLEMEIVRGSDADEDDSEATTIVYFSHDMACATVDNAANTLTVPEGATCDFAQVGVNVTINGALFQGVDTAPVVRLASVTTFAAVHPAGDSGLQGSTHVYRLPCDADYERHTLSSYGTLSDPAIPQRQFSSAHVVYASTNPSVVTASGTAVVVTMPATDGSGTFGSGCTEFHDNAWADCAAIAFNGMAFTVNTSEPLRTYSESSWNGLPGGTGDLTYPYAASTLNLVQNGTLATTFKLSYLRSGMDGSKRVTRA